ncbi:hypothetical protein ACIPYU_07790 [Paenarthrobacter nicotinovorans]|uniref:hypothetical protein n=1 Tax=Paenarthrobacter nicotinovorans TaxID=29320 RepID=UPI0038221C9E
MKSLRSLDRNVIVILFVCVALLVVIVPAFASIGQGVLVFAFVLMPIAALFATRRALNAPYLSPTFIVGAFFTFIGVGGYLLRDLLATAGYRGAGISITLSEAESFNTLALISWMTTLIIVASYICIQSASKRDNEIQEFRKFEWTSKEPSALIVCATILPLLFIVATIGINELVARSYYLIGERGSLAVSLGAPVATAAVVVVGYIFGACRGSKRLLAAALLVAYAAVLFSFGSRRFALIPILFALGVFVASNTRKTRVGLVVGAALTAALLPLPLAFRGAPAHGLLPYLEMFRTLSPLDADWLGALNNVLVSFAIIGRTAFGLIDLNMTDIWISVNPIGGDSAGWYEIAHKMRLNLYTPTAGIGELANVGWVPVAVFSLALGAALAWVELTVRRQVQSGAQVIAAMLLGLTALFSLQMVQYNLRSAVRMLVYLAALELARRFLLLIHGSLSKNKEIRRYSGQRNSTLAKSGEGAKLGR